MKPMPLDEFTDFVSEALPELIASIMRDDRSAVSQGHVSVPQFWALHHIGTQANLTVNALADRLNRSKSSTSALLQRLENSGLIRRNRSSEDHRVIQLSLTARGQNLIDHLQENRKQGIRNTYAALDSAERVEYCRLMEKVLCSIRKPMLILMLAALPCLPSRAEESTNRYTLVESVRLGLRQSLAVLNAARQRKVAETTRKRALSEAYPVLTGIADYSLYDPDNLTESGSKTVGLEASWQVFTGGRTLSAVRASKAYRQLTMYQERRIRETQVRDIIVSYYQVLLAQTQVSVLRESVQQLADFEADTRKKFEAGTASEFDWLSARVALANEKPQLIAAKNNLNLAREEFRNQTYLGDAPFELTDPLDYHPVEIELEEAIATGLSRRPDLLEKASAIALRREDISQQKSDYYPGVSLFANYSTFDPDPYSFLPGSQASGWQEHWSAGARATWTLFDGGLRRANVGESKLNLAIEEDEYRDMERSVSLEIRTQWLRGRDAMEVIRATDENIELADRALEIARTRFDAGLSTNLEVTQANLELSNARLARSQAIYEYLVAVTRIKHAAGTLLEEYEDE